MQAGFGRVNISPPIGTRMFGWGDRDADHGCEGVRDNLFVRALWVLQDGHEMIILGFDLLFFNRDIADRLRGAIGRKFGLAPRQILLNTSHTHNGPTTGTWSYAQFSSIDSIYLDSIEQAIMDACCIARDCVRPVTVLAGETCCDIAVNRRNISESGNADFKPNPTGAVRRNLPVCLLKDSDDQAVCLLFSVSCHPSTVGSFMISADYPGAAMALLDTHLGSECSMFLQGVGGDTKLKSFAGKDEFGSTWEDADEAGKSVAEAVTTLLKSGLRPVESDLYSNEFEICFAMTPVPDQNYFEELVGNPGTNELVRLWAQRMIDLLDRGIALPQSIPVTLHGVRFGKDLRFVGLEGEAVAELGDLINDFFGSGVTFPMGYTDGCQLYIPTTKMLDEGGYEVDSFYEYGWPAQLAPGIDDTIIRGLQRLNI